MLTCSSCRAAYPEGTPACPVDGAPLVAEEALAAANPLLEPGTMVGEYRVDGRLGSGTFGDVYAGEQPLFIGKRVAIKLLRRKFSADPQMVSRFIAEARAVNRIRHRNIIDIFSFGLFGDARNYFVMELLDGLTLGELLRREQRLDVARALPILRGIADALDAAHQAGVTHRDLKPDNVFLALERDGGYFPKLLDFGIAKLQLDGSLHRTATGVPLGTPRYMSPEQCRGKKVDHRADIYALGVVIHEMLTGHALFQADSSMDMLVKHTSEPPEPMSRVGDVPPELDAPVLAMLAKRPDARPSSAGEAVAALAERARASGAAVTRPPEPVRRPGSTFERALVRMEADTIRDGHGPPAPGSSTPAATGAPDSTTAVVTAVPSPALGETLLSAGVTAPVDGAPDTVRAETSDAPKPSATTPPLAARSLDAAAHPEGSSANRSRVLRAVAVVAVAAGVAALALNGGKPAPTSTITASSGVPTPAATTSPAPVAPSPEVTAHPAVTPPDAGLLPDPPRRASPGPSARAASPPPGPRPRTSAEPAPPAYHDDLERPSEFGHPR